MRCPWPVPVLLLASACAAPQTSEFVPGPAEGDILTTAKGGRVIDEGGGHACGPEALGHVAALWDSLPIPERAPLYTRVEVVLVDREHGSVTDWFRDPIRIEVASYASCETVDLALIHELGHAFRALYLGSDFPASETAPELAAARRQEWAELLGGASWDGLSVAAAASCGLDDDHCVLSTEELFAETIRGLLYRPGGFSTVWCHGGPPCWIYDFYDAFPDPRSLSGFDAWWESIVSCDAATLAPTCSVDGTSTLHCDQTTGNVVAIECASLESTGCDPVSGSCQ